MQCARVSFGGSSPRPWGTRRHGPGQARRRRFIPTPVGNTARCCRCCLRMTVHPHARGEHWAEMCEVKDLFGSSPRPWGTHQFVDRRERPRRFIPTPVGNTTSRSTRPARRSVHPHARGEHHTASFSGSPYSGSSPRPWGTPPPDQGGDPRRRFIPTPVGNTPAPIGADGMGAVHPHARGEHRRNEKLPSCSFGSSPRPWGTRCLRQMKTH